MRNVQYSRKAIKVLQEWKCGCENEVLACVDEFPLVERNWANTYNYSKSQTTDVVLRKLVRISRFYDTPRKTHTVKEQCLVKLLTPHIFHKNCVWKSNIKLHNYEMEGKLFHTLVVPNKNLRCDLHLCFPLLTKYPLIKWIVAL